MAQTIVVLSGPVACGKTTLGKTLCTRHGGHRVSTHDLISNEFGQDATPDRTAFQALGERLDRQTGGRWVADALGRRLTEMPEDALVVVDSARIAPQIDGLRAAYGRRIVHIHLWAPLDELAKRYKRRRPKFGEMSSYDQVRSDPTEANIEQLKDDADIVINTFHCSSKDVEVRAASHLGLRGRDWGQLVDVIVGGEYGSEGKGNVAAYVAPEYQLLVRVGGPNAGHKVYTSSGEEFAHRLLPSGTLASDAPLLIGPGAVLDVDTLTDEIARCNTVAPESVDAERLSIDPHAMVISKADVRAEKNLKAAIGSTGKGVGAATARRINGRVRGPGGVHMAQQVEELKPYIREASEVLDAAFARGDRILLEGTQGSALSLYHGHYPYVTSRDTTVSGCLAEAGIPPSRVRKILMVCRSFPIRVENPVGGSSGPMSQPISWAEVARRSKLSATDLRKHERGTVSGNLRRVAEFDWVLLQDSARLNGPTDIALTFADYIHKDNQRARRFEQLTESTIQFIEEIERVAAAPVSLVSTRFHSRSIIDRRAW